MASFLDLIDGANVVSEQHDTGKVNYGGEDAIRGFGGGRPQEPWDASEYGMSLAEAQAKWDNAQTPEARERVIDELRQRAIRRASLDVSNGKVAAFFAGKPAWHGLGVLVDRAATSAEAIGFAGLGWKVEKVPLRYDWNGISFTTDDTFAVVRSDTGAKLGTVGRVYQPVQNADGFNFPAPARPEYRATHPTAGSLYSGKRGWIQAHMPEQRFAVQDGDEIEPYALFSNCHDGSGAAWCLPTTVRVECANTMRMAMNERAKGLSIRHTGNIADKVDAARAALRMAVESFEKFHTVAEQMVRQPAPVKPEIYFGSVLGELIDLSEAERAVQGGASKLDALVHMSQVQVDLAEKTLERKLERKGEVLNDMLERYESERCRPKGSVWSMFNAVTESADHMAGKRLSSNQETRQSRRFESILMGEADGVKQEAYGQAVRMLA